MWWWRMITYILCREKLLKRSNVAICQVHDMDVVSDLLIKNKDT